MHVCICTHTCLCAHFHVCMYVSMCVCMYIKSEKNGCIHFAFLSEVSHLSVWWQRKGLKTARPCVCSSCPRRYMDVLVNKHSPPGIKWKEKTSSRVALTQGTGGQVHTSTKTCVTHASTPHLSPRSYSRSKRASHPRGNSVANWIISKYSCSPQPFCFLWILLVSVQASFKLLGYN